MRGPGRRVETRINTTALGETSLASAPTDGAHYEIDFISVLPSGGANTVGLFDGTAGSVKWSFPLDDNQAFTFDNGSGDYPITLGANNALILNLSAATQVDGFVHYRVVGGNDGM